MTLRNVIFLRNLRTSLANVNRQRILDTKDCIRGLIGVIAEVERAVEGLAYTQKQTVTA